MVRTLLISRRRHGLAYFTLHAAKQAAHSCWGYGKKGPGKKGPGKKGPVKTVQVKTVLGKNGPGKKGPTGYKGVK